MLWYKESGYLGEDTVEPRRGTVRSFSILDYRSPLVVVLVFLAALTAATAVYWSKTIPYPYALENGEGFVMDSSFQVAQGLSPYKSLEDYPLTVGNYPPLYYWLNGLALRVVGLSYAPARAASTLAALAAAGFLFYLVSAMTGEPLAGALAAVFYLSHPTVRNSAALARVDTLAGALAFAGLVATLKLRGRSGLWTGAALFALGLATKHSTVVAPAAAFVGLAVFEPKRALKLAGLTAGMTLVWAASGLTLYGPVMLTNLGPYTATPIEASRIWRHLAQLPPEYLPGLAALPFATLWATRRGGQKRATAVLYGWCALTTLATLGKHGSSLLYLSELTIALSLALGLAAGWALEVAGRMSPGRGALAVTAGCIAFLILRSPPPANPLIRPLAEARAFATVDFQERKAEDARMAALLRAVDGPVLVESADLALAAGKPVQANPFILKWVSRMGLWDEGRLIADVDNRLFGAVQLDSKSLSRPREPLSEMERRRESLTRGRFSEGLLEAVSRSYELAAETPRGVLYRPRPKENAPGSL